MKWRLAEIVSTVVFAIYLGSFALYRQRHSVPSSLGFKYTTFVTTDRAVLYSYIPLLWLDRIINGRHVSWILPPYAHPLSPCPDLPWGLRSDSIPEALTLPGKGVFQDYQWAMSSEITEGRQARLESFLDNYDNDKYFDTYYTKDVAREEYFRQRSVRAAKFELLRCYYRNNYIMAADRMLNELKDSGEDAQEINLLDAQPGAAADAASNGPRR
jgi:hypothetical protein